MTDAVQVAREEVLFTMRHGNWPSDTSVGDKGASERFAKCDAQNAAELDAYRIALLTEVQERIKKLPSTCGSGGKDGTPPCCVSTYAVIFAIDIMAQEN